MLVALESVQGIGSEEEQLKVLSSKVVTEDGSEDAKNFCVALMGSFGQSANLANALALIKKMKTEGKEDPMSLGKMAMAWATGILLGKGGSNLGDPRIQVAASVLQNFDKHFDTNNIDYGWHVLTLATIEAFS